ncbi:hemerythrin domain-containing protein [Saccharophagus degradans]|uniref:Hemerythrin HHE cation binding region n=1 Tax=Saccharophagus degradans (strain 2-40 / ATCC 43961 / DSM 17024) TaxID=203122 RepID=Q21N91_SACD2|nr:hemerythrin domain-containing protein [Saccharophagus degradans]ABD79838.1 Hemerythrin HHE cation binding region [Saccharophagus degradans 2-40]
MDILHSTLSEFLAIAPSAKQYLTSLGIEMQDDTQLLSALQKVNKQDCIPRCEFLYRRAMAERDWSAISNKDLVRYIIRNYHDVHRQQIATLIDLARKVEAIHFGEPDCPTGITKALKKIYSDLDIHMLKEERTVFPHFINSPRTNYDEQIKNAQHDHEDHLTAIHSIKALTKTFSPPAKASHYWLDLYEQLEMLYLDLTDHTYLEDSVLFMRS